MLAVVARAARSEVGQIGEVVPKRGTSGAENMNEVQAIAAGIGSSTEADASTAGREAAEQALAGLSGQTPALVIVYASVVYDLPALLAAIRAVTGDAPQVGATTAGHFHEGEFVGPGSGVEVLALTSGPYRFGVAAREGLAAGDPEELGRRLVSAARAAAAPGAHNHAAVLLLTDGLAGRQQRLLNGIYEVTGAAVPVIGGAAADDYAFRETFIFEGGRVLRDAAAAVWISSDRPLKVVSKHGYRPMSLPMLVTRAEGLCVSQIAGRPAQEVYREAVRDEGSAMRPSAHVGQVREHPLGVIQPDGSHLIRIIRMDDDNGHDLFTFAELPPFAAINVMTGHADDILGVAEPIVSEALAGCEAGVVLMFSCAARYEVLGDRVAEEALLFQHAAGAVPTFGFYTYGEFARNRSVAGQHNATVAALAL
jgi:hypothetical protein